MICAPHGRPLSYDDNGITGPDWGLSEMVFGSFRTGALPPAKYAALLSVVFSQLTVLFNDL